MNITSKTVRFQCDRCGETVEIESNPRPYGYWHWVTLAQHDKGLPMNCNDCATLQITLRVENADSGN